MFNWTAQKAPGHVGLDGLPMSGSRWRHKSGVVYVVLMITNLGPERQEDFPTTVVYLSEKTGKRFSRRLSEWVHYEPV